MDRLLQKLYYDSRTGFIAADKLYRKAKELDKKITRKQVKEWYKKQSLTQEFSQQNQTFPQFKITSNNPNEWQMDLAFWEKQPILITVNINSRIGYAKLLENKQANTIKNAIDEFIDIHNATALMSDNGSEFINKIVQKLLEKESITHATAFVGDHTVLGKIDRFIRTIKARLVKMYEANKFKKLTQRILNEAIENYNNTFHSAINEKPKNMKGKVILEELDHNKDLVQKVKQDFPTGTLVRYKLKSDNPFQKEGAKYSKTVYETQDLHGLKMTLQSANGHILYKPVSDLKIVDSTISDSPIEANQIVEVEKILDHKQQRNGTNKYLVKWVNIDEPTWEPQKNLRLTKRNEMSELEKHYWFDLTRSKR